MAHIEYFLKLFEERGHLAYSGEGVSQIAHAWQCGQLARGAGASNALCLAAWLHDVGHLISELPGSPTLQGLNDAHETLGANSVASVWGANVSEPIRMHVLAKRYLVATVPGYQQKLSADSSRSLILQGGPMNPTECAQFEASPYALDAQRLRAWDDAAKQSAWFPDGIALALDELRQLARSVPTTV